MGVIKHGNRLFGVLRDKQAQADLIRLIRSIDESLPFQCQYVWVESHTDSKYKRRRVVTEMEKENQEVDLDAKAALVDGILERQFISSRFPFETIRIYAGIKKLTGPLLGRSMAGMLIEGRNWLLKRISILSFGR
jgi:hypothetical protein